MITFYFKRFLGDNLSLMIAVGFITFISLSPATTLAASDDPENQPAMAGVAFFGVYELDPAIGINISGTRVFRFNRHGNQGFRHGLAINVNGLLHFTSDDFTPESRQMGTTSIDFGTGYGITSHSAAIALSVNLPTVIINSYLFNYSKDLPNTSFDFFETERLYGRLHGTWFPFRNIRQLSSLGLSAAYDLGLTQNENRLLIGLSFN
jgi:hypothetical protein